MLAADEIERTGERGSRHAGAPQAVRGSRRGGCVRSHSPAPRHVRHDAAQGLPFRIAADRDGDPFVVARAAICAMQRVPIGPIALRPRRRTALRREQRLRHRPQHRLDHREIDPRHAAMPATLPQRGGDDERQHQPAHRIEPGEPDARRNIGMPVQPGKSGVALQQRAVGDGVRLRPGAPETRRRYVDQARDCAVAALPRRAPAGPSRRSRNSPPARRTVPPAIAPHRPPPAASDRARCRASPGRARCAVPMRGRDRRDRAPRP